MTEAITMIQTRRSGTGSGLLHPHHSILKPLLKPLHVKAMVVTCKSYYAYKGIRTLSAMPEARSFTVSVVCDHVHY